MRMPSHRDSRHGKSGDYGDYYPESNFSDGFSEDSYRSGGAVGAGDYISDGRSDSEVSVIYSYDRARGIAVHSEDPSQWDQEKLQLKLQEMNLRVQNQERYIEHQKNKQLRNQEMIDHLQNLKLRDLEEIERKKKECERLNREKSGYEIEIGYYQSLSTNSRVRLTMEQSLNKDIRKQMAKLEKEKMHELQKERDDGIDQTTVDEYKSAKRLLNREQERRKRLNKKLDWYNKELDIVKSHGSSRRVPDGKEVLLSSNSRSALPEINTGRHNLVGIKPCSNTGHLYQSSSTGNGPHDMKPTLAQRRNINHRNVNSNRCGVTDMPFTPAPPTEKTEGGMKKFYRKIKRIVDDF